MKVALLADAQSVHTQRWIRALVAQNIVLKVFSERRWEESPVPIQYLPASRPGRLQVPAAVARVRSALRQFGPDLVHAHYASHWGLYGALAHYHPFLVSVWGADVEVFPVRSWLNARTLGYIFNQANAITASSQYLATVTRRFTSKSITVVPFGIDLTRFTPRDPNQGTELRWIINKALESVYGIDVVLAAMQILKARGVTAWQGKILGNGTERDALMRQVQDFGIADRVEFLGTVSEVALPTVLEWADLGLYASRRESFGVAPLEMMALGRAALAHRVGGLTEVIKRGTTGDFVENLSPRDWADTLEPLVLDPDKVRTWGRQGPDWVRSRYNFEDNVQEMLAVYAKVARSTPPR